jgi:hypothetical protein
MHHARRRLKEQSRIIFDVCRLCPHNCYSRRTLFTWSWHSSFHEIVDHFIHFCKVWPESIWNTLQEFDAPYFAFQMADEVFNLSLHTMTMCLHSKERVAPKSNCVEDVWENVSTFLARNYTHQTVRVHDDEGNGFLFTVFCSLVHYSIIHDPNIPVLLQFLSQVFELLISI